MPKSNRVAGGFKVVVVHRGYGCDTGCCGHVIRREWLDGSEDEKFDFVHPYGDDPLTWAKEWVADEFGAEHVADLDWENCEISDD